MNPRRFLAGLRSHLLGIRRRRRLACVYKTYQATLDSLPFDGTIAGYDWGNTPAQVSVIWMPYHLMFQEFSREITNSVNQLVSYTHRVKAWSVVLSDLSEQTTFEVLNEFIEPMATVALNLPYVLRSRFIFATAHLAHQANRAREGTAWEDNLPFDREIVSHTADKFGAKWQTYPQLKKSLEKISGKDYQETTSDFRNKYNHRFSPRVVIGHVGFVTRIEDATTKNISYGFGELAPLSLQRVASLLDDQCRYTHQALTAFKLLIKEFEGAIYSTARS